MSVDTYTLSSLSMDSSSSRLVALQKLWNYLMSIVANNLLKWNIVITRLGKPSSAEIRGKEEHSSVDHRNLTQFYSLCKPTLIIINFFHF